MATKKKKPAKKAVKPASAPLEAKAYFDIMRSDAQPQYAKVMKNVGEFEKRLDHVMRLGKITGYRPLDAAKGLPSGAVFEIMTPDDVLRV